MSLFFEDLEVGQTWHAGPHTMERDRIVEFAREFDPQAQHLSEEAAAGSMFGELVASGWHTAAVSMRLMQQAAAPILDSGAIGAAIEGISWPEPVRPGDVLRTESEIVELRLSRSRPDRGLMKLKTTTRRADGVVVQVMTGVIFVPRRND